MDKKKDTLEQRIAEDFKKLAQAEEEKTRKEAESEKDIRMPEGTKEAVRARLDEEIKKIEDAEVYDRLSEEDRRALELGRKVLREEKEKEKEKEEKSFEGKTRKHQRRPRRVYIAVAAVLVATLAVSVSAMGGPERMVRMVRQAVGDREVEQVDSSDENLVIVEENEEEAYQKIADEFGVDPVWIIEQPVGMQFDYMMIEPESLLAEVWYRIDNQSVVLIINGIYRESSWGVDMEDEVTREYVTVIHDCKVVVKEYTISSDNEKYTAQFEYNGLEYFLMGTIPKSSFEKIINNLHFY